MNDLVNGKRVSETRHAGSHLNYDNWVRQKLDALMTPEILNNGDKAIQELEYLATQLSNIIDANPNVKINNLPLP